MPAIRRRDDECARLTHEQGAGVESGFKKLPSPCRGPALPLA
jgi:hypothetical protein